MELEIVLTPTQQKSFDGLLAGLPNGSVFALRGDSGLGKSTILQKIHKTCGGVLLSVRQLMGALMEQHPSALEEAFLQLMERSLAGHDLVIMDDLHLLSAVTDGVYYPRTYLLDAALTAILAEAGAREKKVLFAVEDDLPWPIRRRAYAWKIGEFTAEDYASFCGSHLGAAGLDYAKVHRFAPMLNAHQLKNCCFWLRGRSGVDTESFIAYLNSQNMTSNVEIEEVEPVDWHDLKGVDDVIQALEAKIALPFENDALAAELNLKPKRGVLLAGPPGTGKTTIGRALAHRLKGKFFLIDGTLIAGSGDFYCKVREIFEEAKRNAPSIIFIDDTDVIFEGDEDKGFYRYLLTMLDGLESASAERVCVMMTAMNVHSLPAALVRSGRVELWLETRLPDAEARESILREKLAGLPHPMGEASAGVLASASRGLTGADLKAAVEDGKLLFAHDKARGRRLRAAEEYFLEAIATIRGNRRSYARNKPVRFGETVKIGFGVE